MRFLILAYLIFLSGNILLAQVNDRWTAFEDEESQLKGFKNSKGQVMIDPTFMGFTIARSFDNIIAVMEDNNGEYETYYLTKSGKKVGFDSLYVFDNGADCESEGYIRFREKKTYKVGMFDKNGIVIIPADYDELSRVSNGLVWALKDAEKKYWNDHKESGCNHYRWEGGQELLISVENQVLVENFKHDRNIDFYSLSIQQNPTSDSIKVSFIGKNGNYYTFTDTEKHFYEWIKKDLLQNLTQSRLLDFSMDSLTYWKESYGWVSEPKKEFLNRNFEFIKNNLQTILNSGSNNFVRIDGLNSFIYKGDQYNKFFNTCGEAKLEKYPDENIDHNLSQDYFDFLKTDEGYRLISVTLRSEEVK